jgi:hypothetical protein
MSKLFCMALVAGAVFAFVGGFGYYWFGPKKVLDDDQQKRIHDFLYYYLSVDSHSNLADSLKQGADSFRVSLDQISIRTIQLQNNEKLIEQFIIETFDSNLTIEVLTKFQKCDGSFFFIDVKVQDGYYFRVLECEKQELTYCLMSARFLIRESQIQRFIETNPQFSKALTL